MSDFLSKGLWARITKLSKKASRRYVAVAWLARGASQLLRLGEDDVLVVDMGDASVKTGRTDPKEVIAYLRKGVRVFSVENLHAKAFVFDRSVIVGSSNVSGHSADDLIEAAIETSNSRIRSKVIAWIKALALAPVTPKLAAEKLKIYKSPQWGNGRQRSARTKGQANIGRLWIVNTQPLVRTSETEQKTLEQQAQHAKKLLKDASRYNVETIRYNGKSRFARNARLGHVVIRIHSDGSSTDVYPPCRVLSARAYRTGGKKRIGVHLESYDGDSCYYWSAFKKIAVAAGIAVSKHTEKEIRDIAAHVSTDILGEGWWAVPDHDR